MTIKKVESGWQVDAQPGGRGGKRVRKSFRTHAEAKAYENWLRVKASEDPNWSPVRRDSRSLRELIQLWYDRHGRELSSGGGTRDRLFAACAEMGEPTADTFSADMFASYRAKRLEAGISASNMNREHATLRAVFNELSRLGLWERENPLGKLRQFKVHERELSFLDAESIGVLLRELQASRNPGAELIAVVCLSTGARWSEAETLTRSQVRNGQIQFSRTKSRRTRTVPIDDRLQQRILAHADAHGRGVRIFSTAFSAFREAVDRAGLELPAGQLTHVLRHTFASHFMMNGGNILTLQRILGHANLTMTMRYAHLSPEHLQEARMLNPVSKLEGGQTAFGVKCGDERHEAKRPLCGSAGQHGNNRT
nr:tyrosine-type recombinase/integrase [Burkholderia ubonensis]